MKIYSLSLKEEVSMSEREGARMMLFSKSPDEKAKLVFHMVSRMYNLAIENLRENYQSILDENINNFLDLSKKNPDDVLVCDQASFYPLTYLSPKAMGTLRYALENNNPEYHRERFKGWFHKNPLDSNSNNILLMASYHMFQWIALNTPQQHERPAQNSYEGYQISPHQFLSMEEAIELFEEASVLEAIIGSIQRSVMERFISDVYLRTNASPLSS